MCTGPSAPLASGLTSWLLTHPMFEVMCPGVLPTSKFYTQKSASSPVSAQQKTPQTKNTAGVAQKGQKQTSTPLLRQTLLIPRTAVKATTVPSTTTAPSQVSQLIVNWVFFLDFFQFLLALFLCVGLCTFYHKQVTRAS